MRLTLFLLFSLSLLTSFAQENEFPDYRSKKENFQRLRDPAIRSDLATFTSAGLDESMGKQPLKTIPATEFSNNLIAFEGNGIHVSIQALPFNPDKHKLNYFEKHLVKIDGKPYYGNYGKVPVTQLQSLTVLVNGDTIPVPAVALADFYDPSFSFKDNSGVQRSQNRVYLSADDHTIYIYLLNRNNGGTEATWIIRDKKYLQRVLDFGFLK